MITTTVTWADLRADITDELADLRDAYHELRDQATDEYGADALDEPLPDDPEDVADENRRLWAYQRQADQLNQAKESIDQRLNVLETLEDELGSGDFEVTMLSGQDTMDLETRLRTKAASEGVDVDTIQHLRELWVVDAATVSAPEGVPTDDEGSPTPSKCPNALVTSLYEQINRLNNAGTVDFTSGGFGSPDDTTPTTAESAAPTDSDA